MIDWLGQSDYFQWSIVKSQLIPTTINKYFSGILAACESREQIQPSVTKEDILPVYEVAVLNF